MSDTKEIAKELTISIINKINGLDATHSSEEKNTYIAEEVARIYKIIYETVKQD